MLRINKKSLLLSAFVATGWLTGCCLDQASTQPGCTDCCSQNYVAPVTQAPVICPAPEATPQYEAAPHVESAPRVAPAPAPHVEPAPAPHVEPMPSSYDKDVSPPAPPGTEEGKAAPVEATKPKGSAPGKPKEAKSKTPPENLPMPK